MGSEVGAGPVVTDYRAIAEQVLPGGALGTRLMPEEVRTTIASAHGSRIVDVEGGEWIDYVCGAGALILGHQHPAVVAAVQEQAARSMHQYGSPTDVALHLAAEITRAVPNGERMVFATTGSEATFYTMRMARAYTGKEKILKFEGAFHGNHDYAGVAVAPKEPSPYPRGMPSTGGVPVGATESVLVAPYNDLDRLEAIVSANVDDLAGIIVEPVQRIVKPVPGFLPGLRDLCDRYEVVLIFDEVVTGFRLAYGGAQEHFGVTADLSAYGKIVGGGGPIAAVVGRAELIDQAHPHRAGRPGYVYASGTLHGNPLAAAAGLATLERLRAPGFYDELHAATHRLAEGIGEVLERHGRPALVDTAGSLWHIMHIAEPPRSYTDVLASDRAANIAFDTALMREGINVLPGLRRFVSSAHTDDDFAATIDAVDRACKETG